MSRSGKPLARSNNVGLWCWLNASDAGPIDRDHHFSTFLHTLWLFHVWWVVLRNGDKKWGQNNDLCRARDIMRKQTTVIGPRGLRH
jgi:hypothetical protein